MICRLFALFTIFAFMFVFYVPVSYAEIEDDVALPLPIISPAHDETVRFRIWLDGLRDEAKRAGISDSILDASLSDIQPIPRIIELDRRQPEGTMTFGQYRSRIVSDARISRGQDLYQQHLSELRRIELDTGVPARVIVALWGLETSYGDLTGGYQVVPALATLAYDGRRADFFRSELLQALQILEDGNVTPAAMTGSWAGAMGQCQFMPSSFNNFAVDGNGDGRRDIWGSVDDVFASAANYLVQNGWKAGERWGREVRLPNGFDESLLGLSQTRSLSEWRELGLMQTNGRRVADIADMEASLVRPGGDGDSYFLAYHNYRVIMRWNNSTYFASTVGLMADEIIR